MRVNDKRNPFCSPSEHECGLKSNAEGEERQNLGEQGCCSCLFAVATNLLEKIQDGRDEDLQTVF